MSTARHPSLESAFAAPPRGSALAGILAPRDRTTGTTLEPAVAPEVPSPTDVAGAPRPRPTRRSSAARPARAGTRNVAAYLPPATLQAAGEWTRTNDQTYADLLVKAFDEVAPDVLRRAFVPRSTSTSAGMPRRAVVPRGATGIQRQVRLDDAQLAWLDQQVVDLGAPSRSALIAAVVGIFLGTHQE